METIKVNMTPCEDVQTIHASQNDAEAREWGFELHNNGEKIDSSSISDQLVFKAYKGGTEQLLPENTSTPTTSPFLGDIKYPQGLLTDQEFLYRESPTEQNGYGKFKALYGNTLVWNQLVQNGNFASGMNSWQVYNEAYTSASVSSNVLTQKINTAVSGLNNAYQLGIQQTIPSMVSSHTYIVKVTATPSFQTSIRAELGGTARYESAVVSANTKISIVFTASPSEYNKNILFYPYSGVIAVVNQTIKYENIMCIDLTQLGLNSADQFSSLFPLPYYAYNAGTLLSFNGTGLKTVGKNQLNPSVLNDLTTWQYVQLYLLPNTTYSCSSNSPSPVNSNAPQFFVLEEGHSADIDTVVYDGHSTLVRTGNNGHLTLQFRTRTDGAITDYNWQLEVGSSPSSYEPYTSSTTSLPISTYFPTGMKSAGSVYDELTPTKAITRIGAVDLGSLTYTYDGECFIGRLPMDARELSANTEKLNSITSIYQINNWTAVKFNKTNMTLGTGVNRYICIFNSSYTDPSAFKTAMNGVYLYYELANPTETSFTTASLVTENAEIPLSNEDGVLIGKCTEQLSENPGFIDAKIKLSDSDGTCYSNKIQLHIERSPQ